jgi:hypothetical protein
LVRAGVWVVVVVPVRVWLCACWERVCGVGWGDGGWGGGV